MDAAGLLDLQRSPSGGISVSEVPCANTTPDIFTSPALG